METRMELYEKYRREIRLMSEADFAQVKLSPEQKEQLTHAVSPKDAAEKVSSEWEEGRKSAPNLNAAFLKKRKSLLITKILAGAALFLAFLVWGILLVRSK